MNIKKTLWIAVLAGAALLAACDDKKADGGGDKASADDMPKACADYINQMETCMKKMPDAAKPAMESSIKAMKDSFKAAGDNADARKAMEPGCKTGAEALAKNPACK